MIMSHTTLILGREAAAIPRRERKASRGPTLLDRFMAVQQARADRLVRPYLARMPKADLEALGFSESEIEDIARDRHIPVVRWV